MIPIRCNGGVLFINPGKISCIQATRKWVKVDFDGESCVLKSSLDIMEQQLKDSEFVRIHRRTIVNVNRIRELRSWLRGSFQVFLQDGTQLLLSKKYRINVFRLLGTLLG